MPQLLLTRNRVIHHSAFGVRRVLCKVQQVVKLKFWRRPRPLERFHIVAKPAFVAELQDMGAANMGENIAPVVIVLDEISLSKTLAIEAAEAI